MKKEYLRITDSKKYFREEIKEAIINNDSEKYLSLLQIMKIEKIDAETMTRLLQKSISSSRSNEFKKEYIKRFKNVDELNKELTKINKELNKSNLSEEKIDELIQKENLLIRKIDEKDKEEDNSMYEHIDDYIKFVEEELKKGVKIEDIYMP